MDINCDLGEGRADDDQLMPYVDSCNIACGGHAGDKDSMKKTLRLAKRFNVRAGAHPSFVDKPNFGRKSIRLPLSELKSQLIHQIAALNEIAKADGIKLKHVKAHGALYNEAAQSRSVAEILIEAVTFFDEDLCIFVPYGSLLADEVQKRNIPHWVEVFADRNYDDELRLVSRSRPDAIIFDPIAIKERVLRMRNKKLVRSISGNEMHIDFDTLCVHGDHPKALEILKALDTLNT